MCWGEMLWYSVLGGRVKCAGGGCYGTVCVCVGGEVIVLCVGGGGSYGTVCWGGELWYSVLGGVMVQCVEGGVMVQCVGGWKV